MPRDAGTLGGVRLGLVLLFDDDFGAACVAYSAALLRERSAIMQLGEQALPHVSLLHADTDRAPAEIWADASRHLEAEYTLETHSVALLPHGDSGRMAYLIVPCTPALRAAEVRALALESLQDAPIATRNGDSFQPHFTVAIWEGRDSIATTELPADVVPRTALVGRLALVEIGPHGTCRRVVNEVKPRRPDARG